jgi:ADP-dependent phosphofructokinase/glucokinase
MLTFTELFRHTLYYLLTVTEREENVSEEELGVAHLILPFFWGGEV